MIALRRAERLTSSDELVAGAALMWNGAAALVISRRSAASEQYVSMMLVTVHGVIDRQFHENLAWTLI